MNQRSRQFGSEPHKSKRLSPWQGALAVRTAAAALAVLLQGQYSAAVANEQQQKMKNAEYKK